MKIPQIGGELNGHFFMNVFIHNSHHLGKKFMTRNSTSTMLDKIFRQSFCHIKNQFLNPQSCTSLSKRNLHLWSGAHQRQSAFVCLIKSLYLNFGWDLIRF